jgi:hypothetical protein
VLPRLDDGLGERVASRRARVQRSRLHGPRAHARGGGRRRRRHRSSHIRRRDGRRRDRLRRGSAGDDGVARGRRRWNALDGSGIRRGLAAPRVALLRLRRICRVRPMARLHVALRARSAVGSSALVRGPRACIGGEHQQQQDEQRHERASSHRVILSTQSTACKVWVRCRWVVARSLRESRRAAPRVAAMSVRLWRPGNRRTPVVRTGEHPRLSVG